MLCRKLHCQKAFSLIPFLFKIDYRQDLALAVDIRWPAFLFTVVRRNKTQVFTESQGHNMALTVLRVPYSHHRSRDPRIWRSRTPFMAVATPLKGGWRAVVYAHYVLLPPDPGPLSHLHITGAATTLYGSRGFHIWRSRPPYSRLATHWGAGMVVSLLQTQVLLLCILNDESGHTARPTECSIHLVDYDLFIKSQLT